MDRPPADPVKLLASWTEWETGETTPGRVMSDLKTGGLRDVVQHLAEEPSGVPADDVDLTEMLATWMEWETGTTPPGTVMTRLHETGLRRLLESLAAPAGEGGEG